MDIARLSLINGLSGSMKTGNDIFDIVLLSLIPIFVGLVFQRITNIALSLESLLTQIKSLFVNEVTVEIVHKSTGDQSKQQQVSPDLNLIQGIIFVCQEDIRNKCTRNVLSSRQKYKKPYKNYYSEMMDNEFDWKPQQRFEYVFEKTKMKIWYQHKIIAVSSSDSLSSESNVETTSDTNIIIKCNDAKAIQNFCKFCYQEYTRHHYGHLDEEKLLAFVLLDRNKSDTGIKYLKLTYETNKSFDNVFFPGKQNLMRILSRFPSAKEAYAKSGIPWRETILLYGEPGTGKTSLIKAIANLTQRDIFYVNIKSIKNDVDLMKCFFEESIVASNHYYNAPLNNRIYCFEDIDAATDVVISRTEQPVDDIVEATNPLAGLLGEMCTDDFNNSITLSGLLNSLDGIFEVSGAIIIITTNHLEKLDPALLREGRITMKINLTFMKHPEIHEMFEYRYGISIPFDEIQQIAEDKTPSKIENTINKHADYKEAIAELCL